MIGFYSATSSFLASLKKSYRKEVKKANSKKYFLTSQWKKFKIIFLIPEDLSNNPSPRLEKVCWPVMVVEKGKNIDNFWKIANFNKTLLKFNI